MCVSTLAIITHLFTYFDECILCVQLPQSLPLTALLLNNTYPDADNLTDRQEIDRLYDGKSMYQCDRQLATNVSKIYVNHNDVTSIAEKISIVVEGQQFLDRICYLCRDLNHNLWHIDHIDCQLQTFLLLTLLVMMTCAAYQVLRILLKILLLILVTGLYILICWSDYYRNLFDDVKLMDVDRDLITMPVTTTTITTTMTEVTSSTVTVT